MKRVLVASDTHCGHVVGLTPPVWQMQTPTDTNGHRHRRGRTRFAEVQAELWRIYTEFVDALRPIDILLFNGDAVEGKGPRSGGTELITSDRTEQVAMSARCINYIGAQEIIMTYGTPAHTGVDEDWEDLVADKVKARKIGGHEWLDVNGVIFDLKHFCSASSIPHGRYTAAAREDLWNRYWAGRGEAPRADVLIRSHVHYYAECSGVGWRAMTTPALQGKGSKYGARKCSGLVDFGLISFDVQDDGRYSWTVHSKRVVTQIAKTIKL